MFTDHRFAAPSLAAVLLIAASSGGLARNTGLVFVSNERTNNLVVIDPKTNRVVKDLKTSRRPRDMHFHLIDADSGNVVQELVVGRRPRRFAATPDGKELWVSTELSGEVYIIDREKFSVEEKIEFLPPGHAQERRDAGRSSRHPGR